MGVWIRNEKSTQLMAYTWENDVKVWAVDSYLLWTLYKSDFPANFLHFLVLMSTQAIPSKDDFSYLKLPCVENILFE